MMKFGQRNKGSASTVSHFSLSDAGTIRLVYANGEPVTLSPIIATQCYEHYRRKQEEKNLYDLKLGKDLLDTMLKSIKNESIH